MRSSNPSKPPARTAEAAPLSLDQFLTNTQDGIFALNRDRKFVLFNAAAERITGYTAREVIGTNCSCHAFIDCHDEQGRSLAGFLCPARHLGGNAEASGARQRMRLRRKNGSHLWVETIYTPLRNAAGEIELFLGIMRDITDEHARESDLIATLAELRAENERLREERRGRFGFATIVSRSSRMQPVFELIRAAIERPSPVLIVGEKGAGKDLVARTIHENSPQRGGPFVVVPTQDAARTVSVRDLFADGQPSSTGPLIESARGGTLYFDDLTRLSSEVQIHLARWLAESSQSPSRNQRQRPRTIAALSEEPAAAISATRVRSDLLNQLGSLFIQLPPLRSRREDIPSLVQHFLDQLNVDGGRRVADISPKAWSVLLAHQWPGNVSELLSVIQSAHHTGKGPLLQTNDFPHALQNAPPAAEQGSADSLKLDPLLERIERQAILDALRQAKGQRNIAARLMGISRSRLYRRMEVLGILQPPAGSES